MAYYQLGIRRRNISYIRTEKYTLYFIITNHINRLHAYCNPRRSIHDILHVRSFFEECWRLLRPTYAIFLKTGWWNSNSQTSGICRYLQTKYNLHISISQSQFKNPLCPGGPCSNANQSEVKVKLITSLVSGSTRLRQQF